MTEQAGYQTNTIYKFPNISRSKINQTINFVYNNINVFLQKLCREWGRETSSRPLFGF